MRAKRSIIVFVFSMLAAFAFASISYAETTFSAAWAQDSSGNWNIYQTVGNERKQVKNAWVCDDAVAGNGQNVWYLIDHSGAMVSAGLVKDGTGNYYSLETNHNGYYGMLRYQTGDYNCNGQTVHLELESVHNGSFAAIKNNDAIEKLKAIYGLPDVSQINNSNIFYTSAWVKTTTKGTGGPGGGGGSSGGGSNGGTSSGGNPGSQNSYDVEDFYGDIGDYSVSSEKQAKVNSVIKDFVDTYITIGMTDFEKEMTIIQWMVENITYDEVNYRNKTIPQDDYTTYGALVNRICVCDGYAHAFVDICDACGITARRISNYGHAWNLIRLDGDWYHVDVTWEDPIGNSIYGFGNLRNQYINLTDTEIAASHAHWHESTPAAMGRKYGHLVVERWIQTGELEDPDVLEEEQRISIEQMFAKIEKDGGKVIIYSNTKQVADEIVDFLSPLVDERMEIYPKIAIRFVPPLYTRSRLGDYNTVTSICKEIAEIVNNALMAKYPGIIEKKILSLSAAYTGDLVIYGIGRTQFHYTTGNRAKLNYTIKYVVTGTDTLINEISGIAEIDADVIVPACPDGYDYDGYSLEENSNIMVKFDENSPIKYHIESFRIQTRKDAELTINIRPKGKKWITFNCTDQEGRTILRTGRYYDNDDPGSFDPPEISGFVCNREHANKVISRWNHKSTFTIDYYKFDCMFTLQYVNEETGEVILSREVEYASGVDYYVKVPEALLNEQGYYFKNKDALLTGEDYSKIYKVTGGKTYKVNICPIIEYKIGFYNTLYQLVATRTEKAPYYTYTSYKESDFSDLTDYEAYSVTNGHVYTSDKPCVSVYVYELSREHTYKLSFYDSYHEITQPSVELTGLTHGTVIHVADYIDDDIMIVNPEDETITVRDFSTTYRIFYIRIAKKPSELLGAGASAKNAPEDPAPTLGENKMLRPDCFAEPFVVNGTEEYMTVEAAEAVERKE